MLKPFAVPMRRLSIGSKELLKSLPMALRSGQLNFQTSDQTWAVVQQRGVPRHHA